MKYNKFIIVRLIKVHFLHILQLHGKGFVIQNYLLQPKPSNKHIGGPCRHSLLRAASHRNTSKLLHHFFPKAKVTLKQNCLQSFVAIFWHSFHALTLGMINFVMVIHFEHYKITRGEVSVNTRYFIEHLIFLQKSIKHFLYK